MSRKKDYKIRRKGAKLFLNIVDSFKGCGLTVLFSRKAKSKT